MHVGTHMSLMTARCHSATPTMDTALSGAESTSASHLHSAFQLSILANLVVEALARIWDIPEELRRVQNLMLHRRVEVNAQQMKKQADIPLQERCYCTS